MKKIAVKAGIKNIHLFENENVPIFEAYTEFNDDLNGLLKTPMKLASIHLSNYVEIDGKYEVLNFNSRGIVGNISRWKLHEAIEFANKHKVDFIVIHLGYFNSLKEKRNHVISSLAKEFNDFETGNVKICIENIPHWIDLSFENEPIICNELHMLQFKKECSSVGFVLDIDHLAINTVFNDVLEKSIDKKVITKGNIRKLRMKIGENLIELTRRDKDYYSSLINKSIVKFFPVINPEIIHASGSDYCNYMLKTKLPLIGEGLPLNYCGKIKGYTVKDRIDHSQWMNAVSDDVLIIIELLMRDEYDYVVQSRMSKCFLEKQLISDNIVNKKIL